MDWVLQAGFLSETGWAALFAHDVAQQRLYWGEHMLNFQSTIATLELARFTLPRMFVRPVHDSKHFTGRVFSEEEFVAWQGAICKRDRRPLSRLGWELC